MKIRTFANVTLIAAVCLWRPLSAKGGDAEPAATAPGGSSRTAAPLDLAKAQAEVETRYAKAHPEIQEYVLWTAKQAWAAWWQSQGHAPLDSALLKPWTPAPRDKP